MKISLASDHGGYLLKDRIIRYLTELGHETVDFGCNAPDSVDYSDFAFPAALAVAEGKVDRGIVVCTTGIGVSICANKVRGVRCALCTSEFQAEMTRRHNDTNVLALGAKIVSEEQALEIVHIWIDTAFEGGRHARRIEKITAFEDQA